MEMNAVCQKECRSDGSEFFTQVPSELSSKKKKTQSIQQRRGKGTLNKKSILNHKITKGRNAIQRRLQSIAQVDYKGIKR